MSIGEISWRGAVSMPRFPGFFGSSNFSRLARQFARRARQATGGASANDDRWQRPPVVAAHACVKVEVVAVYVAWLLVRASGGDWLWPGFQPPLPIALQRLCSPNRGP